MADANLSAKQPQSATWGRYQSDLILDLILFLIVLVKKNWLDGLRRGLAERLNGIWNFN